MEKAKTKDNLPLLMSANDLQAIGMCRSIAYRLLNRGDAPVIKIGKRKFMDRDKFFNWLENQSVMGGGQ